MEYVLAADIGGTNIRVGIVDRSGRITGQEFASTPSHGTAEEIAGAISDVAVKAMNISGLEVDCFGLALPAIIDFSSGKISIANNLQQLNGVDLGQLVAARTGLKIVLANDSVSTAIGEHWLGAAKDSYNVICVTLGTGVGGGLIFSGEAYLGANGSAGHLGHICVEPNGHPCPCGSRGCIEQYASATAIVRMAKERDFSPDSGDQEFTARDISEAASVGDRIAISVFDTMGYYLGIALGGLVNSLNPELIVLTGGAAAAWPHFIQPTFAEMKKRAFQQPLERVKIVRGALGNDAGLLGAAYRAFNILHKGNSVS